MVTNKKVFLDLAIKMIGFGVCIGVAFPFFTILFGVEKHIALSFEFFIACIGAGILVGLCSILITKLTVGKKLSTFIERMKKVNLRIIDFGKNPKNQNISTNNYLITEESNDEFGACAIAFNVMVESLVDILHIQKEQRQYMETLSEELELDNLCIYALKALLSYSGASAGAVLIAKEGKLDIASVYGIKRPETIEENPIVMDVLKTGKRALVDYPKDISIDGILTEFTPSQLIIEPIVYHNIVSGVIILASSIEFNKDFLDHFDLFVYSFSLVLKNSLQHEQIQKLAALDPLTGIYNRRFGMNRLNEEYARSIRTNTPLGVMMMDLDKFKIINDTYGHLAGDRVIKNLVNVVQKISRNGDIFVRHGGEEFLLMLPGANKEDVFGIAERSVQDN